MAKNWNVAEAYNEIKAGNKDAIVDIGRRFPLATTALAANDMKALTDALNFITVRKIESILKDGVQPVEDDEDEVATEEPKTEDKPKRGRKAKKEEPVMNEPEDDEEDGDDLESKSEVELFKLAKSKGLNPQPKKTKKYYIDLINKANDSSDDEDDWDEDDEEEEKLAKKAPAKKPAKKPAKEVVKKAEKKAAPKKAKEEDDEDDDWDI